MQFVIMGIGIYVAIGAALVMLYTAYFRKLFQTKSNLKAWAHAAILFTSKDEVASILTALCEMFPKFSMEACFGIMLVPILIGVVLLWPTEITDVPALVQELAKRK